MVDITVTGNFSSAEKSDELTDTVDYCAVYAIVKSEMAVRSKLIEHVAKRILDSLRKEYPAVSVFEVSVTKINPPLNGPVDNVVYVVQG